jgi:hypothetical protein
MIPPLDPVVAQIIPLLPLRDTATMTPQSARDALRALAASRAAVPPPVMSAEDVKVKGAAGFLDARAYRNASDKSPTVVFFHGGGWVAGDLDTHDRQARWLAIETGAVVVSVDYRRPPEIRFPGAFEDAFAATKDVVARIAEFGGDEKRVGVAGDSAVEYISYHICSSKTTVHKIYRCQQYPSHLLLPIIPKHHGGSTSVVLRPTTPCALMDRTNRSPAANSCG